MPQRYPCDLSHFNFNQGDIGKLQTLAIIPIIAGDSIGIDMHGIWRLSPLRRQLVVDVKVDLFAFFVPHRHVYGDEWIQYIKDGKNENANFPFNTAASNLDYLGCQIDLGEDYPLWMAASYNQVFNRYFRSPSDASKEFADNYETSDSREIRNGFHCGYLPVPWSTGVDEGVPESEREVDATADTFDIVDLNRVQAEYKTEVDRTYFGERYNDLLNTEYGSTVNTDADQRPTLVARDSFWLSGYDVDGTDDAALGTYSGKSAGVGGMSFRRRFFREHGSLRVVGLVRFPTIHEDERPQTCIDTVMAWENISGNPAIVAAEPPRPVFAQNYFKGVTGELGTAPFGQHYRYHPSTVHRAYDQLDGWSFISNAVDTKDRAWYIQNLEYDDVFQTTQLAHWQSHLKFDVDCRRVVPPARVSLYAGV